MTSQLKKLDPLTSLVTEYQHHPSSKTLRKIHNSTKRLVYKVISYYGMLRYPQTIQDDIEEDCRSFVLMKSIARFDGSRGAKFATYYTWWCMSHVRARKNFYSIRRQEIDRVNFDTPKGNSSLGEDVLLHTSRQTALQDTLTNSNIKVFECFKRKMKNIFYGKSILLELPGCDFEDVVLVIHE